MIGWGGDEESVEDDFMSFGMSIWVEGSVIYKNRDGERKLGWEKDFWFYFGNVEF